MEDNEWYWIKDDRDEWVPALFRFGLLFIGGSALHWRYLHDVEVSSKIERPSK